MWRTLTLLLLLTACAPGTRSYLKEEDDFFNPVVNQDKNYTQGLRLGAEIPDVTGSHEYYGQQLFYTPAHKHLVDPIETERPYAGYLAAGYKANYNYLSSTKNTWGIETGLVGPHAYGKEIQNWFHGLIKNRASAGWDAQLHDEPTLVLTGESRTRFVITDNSDLTSLLGVNAGNLFDQVYTGATIRYGYNIANDFYHNDPIYPRAPRNVPPPVDPLRAYVLAGIGGKEVARNMLLDGNTFRDSRSVSKYPFVAEGRLGATVEYSNYSLSYIYMAQTPEFKYEGMFGTGTVQLGYLW